MPSSGCADFTACCLGACWVSLGARWVSLALRRFFFGWTISFFIVYIDLVFMPSSKEANDNECT